jgi:hypothetical protein
MDQDDPFPEDFFVLQPIYVCAGTTANRSTVQMTRFNFYKCIYLIRKYSCANSPDGSNKHPYLLIYAIYYEIFA